MPRNSARARALLLLMAACSAVPPAVELSHPVRFVGAEAVPEATLRQVLATAWAMLQPQPGTPEALRTAGSDAVARAYRARGYADVSVASAPEGDTFVYTVQEGRRWTLSALEVAGSSVFSREELLHLWQMLPGPGGRLVEGPPLAAGDPFDAERLDHWAALVAAKYIDAGYLDVRLDVPELVRDAAAGSVRATLRIAHEGPRYTIRAFEVPDLVRGLLGDDMPPEPVGEPCTRARTEAFAGAVLAGLRRRGHPEPHLRVGALRDQERAEVTLNLTVQAGPARTVEEIVVSGNRRVPEDLIRDKFPLRPGDRFDGDVERRGLAALSATGEFADLDVRYEPVGDDGLRLVLDTTETTGLVLKGAPYVHPWRRLGYNLFLEGRDALGERHDLMGRVDVGHRGYLFSGRYLRSGIFGANTSLTLGGDFYARERPAFTDRGAGGTLELRRYVSPGLSIAASYSALEHFDTTFDARATTTVGRDYTEGRLSLLFELDRTDNRLLPTRGHAAHVRCDWVDESLGADVRFLRLRAGAAAFVPLSERVRWSVAAESGWLWPGEGSAGVPVPERFFLGGYDSVRSFRESRLGPRDATGALRGGEFKTFARTELIVRTIDPMEVGLFADAGSLSADVSDRDLDDMRYALGAALRLVSREAGPVVVSAAWNPDRERGEDEWVVDFAAGVLF
jgi:outer membrane protein insertion porin family